ncbi:hypothetical protein BDZ89DRAFT_1062091 [Hymenopellis radicata]|nr:hypothetical protein BDZ89DRAFT_1062091 [Hymenopellis radicata]
MPPESCVYVAFAWSPSRPGPRWPNDYHPPVCLLSDYFPTSPISLAYVCGPTRLMPFASAKREALLLCCSVPSSVLGLLRGNSGEI